MSHYSSDYTYKFPVLVDNRSGSATIDASFTIPSEWGRFWSEIDSNGYGLRVTESDGVTLVTYQLASWTYATRTATIEVDDWSPPGSDGWYVLWLYFGIASPTDGAGSFTAASAKTGYIHIAEPTVPNWIAQRVADGSSVPPVSYQTDPEATLRLYCDITAELAVQEAPLNGSVSYEEVNEIAFAATNAGVADTNIWTADSLRLHIFSGRLFASVEISNGASGNDYMDTFTINTTLGRELVYSITRNVQTPAES